MTVCNGTSFIDLFYTRHTWIQKKCRQNKWFWIFLYHLLVSCPSHITLTVVLCFYMVEIQLHSHKIKILYSENAEDPKYILLNYYILRLDNIFFLDLKMLAYNLTFDFCTKWLHPGPLITRASLAFSCLHPQFRFSSQFSLLSYLSTLMVLRSWNVLIKEKRKKSLDSEKRRKKQNFWRQEENFGWQWQGILHTRASTLATLVCFGFPHFLQAVKTIHWRPAWRTWLLCTVLLPWKFCKYHIARGAMIVSLAGRIFCWHTSK